MWSWRDLGNPTRGRAVDLNGSTFALPPSSFSGMETTTALRERCPISTVNYHLWKPCNMRCTHCFAHFSDAGHTNLPRADSLDVVRELARGFERITLVGGEPTLCPWLLEALAIARDAGLRASIVTNGWRLVREPEFAIRVLSRIEWLGLSVDSADDARNRAIGRVRGHAPIERSALVQLAQQARQLGVGLKINTVVLRQNVDEDLADLILDLRPSRWKLLQVLPVEGQNDESYARVAVSSAEFLQFVDRHRGVARGGVVIVPEGHDALTGSYAMVDPGGFAFDNLEGRYRYSSAPVHRIGWQRAFGELCLDVGRFRARGGDYAERRSAS